MWCADYIREMDTYGVYPSSAVIKAISLVRVMKTGLLQLEIHSRVLGSGHLQVVGKGEILVLPGVPNTQTQVPGARGQRPDVDTQGQEDMLKG